jgi:anti-sigma regulatory factor (Ser/Thr protein kinase)
MPPPFGPSTVDTRDHDAPADGDGVRRPTLDYSSSGDSVVWGAAAPLSPTALSATERRFKFRGLPQAVGAARRVLRRWEDHFEPDLFYDLSLCVSELVTNAVQRGEPEGGDEIELVVRRDKELVRVEVREPQPDVVITQSPVGAPSCWGMFIVDRVADRWGVDRGEGTVVWCEIDLASDGWSRRTPPLGRTLST